MIKEEGSAALFAGIVPLRAAPSQTDPRPLCPRLTTSVTGVDPGFVAVLKEVLFVMSKFAVFEFVRAPPTHTAGF